jgi:hypothetical protein
MAKFQYIHEDNEFNREASTIEFTVPDDMNINEFKVMCVRMAHAIGYHQNSITKAFGDLNFGNDDKDKFIQLLNELNIKSNR